MKYYLKKFSIFFLLIYSICSTRTSYSQTTYTIYTDNILHTVDEKIYGHFLEHIYNSANNGLWGDLVWNRSMERTGGTNGIWHIEDSVIIQSLLNENIRLLFGETDWQDYEITLQAKKIGGAEGFLIIFRANNDNFYWFNIGGWSNSEYAIEKGTLGAGRWSVLGNLAEPGSIVTNQWYNLKIRCDSNHFQTWIDNDLIFDFIDDEAHLSGQVGIGTWVTQASYKNIVVTEIPGGDTLFSGLPDIDNEEEIILINWEKAGSPELYRNDSALNSDFCVKIVNKDTSEAGIEQNSLNLIAQTYHGSFWARGVSPGGLKVKLLNSTNILAYKDFPAPDTIWQEYSFELNPCIETTNGTLQIIMNDTGTVYLDQISMIGQDAIDNNGYRPDLFQAIDSLKPPIIRWPGGCYASAYFWKDGIGPQYTRKAYQVELWNDKDVNSYGTDEFLQMCDIIGAEPIIVINSGVLNITCGAPIIDMLTPVEYLQDALDWMEYCNGADTTTWGAVRAVNGHPEPYNVKYWEIDNETWSAGVGAYIDKVKEFAPAMRAKYPDVKIIACGGSSFDQSWNNSILNECADIIDYISVHHYEDINNYRSGVIDYENFIKQLGNNIASSSNPNVKIYMSEWNVSSGLDWRNGLYAAGMLNVFERQGEVFEMGGPALFLRHTSAGSSWNNAFINFNNSSWFPAPNYVVMKLWREHYAPNFVQTTGINSSLNVASTLSKDTSELYFKIVNTSNSDIQVTVDVKSPFFPGNAYLKQITALLYSQNTFSNPNKIKVENGIVSVNKQLVTFTSPKYSAAVVKIEHDSTVGIKDIDFYEKNGSFRLYPNQPNPFSDYTIIKYDILKAGHVTLRILDLSGRVKSILVDKKLEPGNYEVKWNGKDEKGHKINSGIYLYEMVSPTNYSQKMMVMFY